MYNLIAVTSQDKIAGTHGLEMKKTFVGAGKQFSGPYIISNMQRVKDSGRADFPRFDADGTTLCPCHFPPQVPLHPSSCR